MSFISLSYLAYLRGLLDLKLAVTLVIVEVPITGVVSAIISEGLHQKSKLSTEAKKRKAEELRSYLKDHYNEELMPTLREWFYADFPSSGPRYLVESAIHYSSAVFGPNGQSHIRGLADPTRHGMQVAELKQHLGAQNWKSWEKLKAETDSYLQAVVKAWLGIESDLKANRFGLVDADSAQFAPANRYRSSALVPTIWQDADQFEASKKHEWDQYPIIQQHELYHREDGSVAHEMLWEFGGVWVCAKDKKDAEDFRNYLNEVSKKATGPKVALKSQLRPLKEDADEFWLVLKSIIDNYEIMHQEITTTCARCKPWIDRLEELGAR